MMFRKTFKLPDNLKVAMVATRRAHTVPGAFRDAHRTARCGAEWTNHSFLMTFLIGEGYSGGGAGPGVVKGARVHSRVRWRSS